MVGLEIAGVVLGAIPLVISALEHYGNGIRVISDARHYAIVFDDCSTQLDASIGIYKNTCYELLGPLHLPDSQMTALLIERKPEAWSEMDLQAALKVRLGDNHRRYTSLQVNLHKRILLLCQKLKLEDNGRPPWVAADGMVDEKARKKFFRKFWVKTRGGFNAEKYKTLLADIDRDIEKLSKLATGPIQLEPIKISNMDKLQSAYCQTIRDQAQRVFGNLSIWFTPCLCAHQHQANLRLEIGKTPGAEGDPSRLGFLLTFEKPFKPASSPPWDWRNIEIESSRLSVETVASGTSQTQASGKKAAHFLPSISISPPAVLQSPASNLHAKIDDLCRALMVARQHDCCLGVLEDEGWQHHVYSVVGPATGAQISDAVSLQDLIHSAKNIPPRQKCMLALTLATSVLQLHNTSWLPCTWETKDIFFLRKHGGNTIPSLFYVSRSFASASQATSAGKRRRSGKNEMVFALGVALLELAYGAPVLSFSEPEDLSEDGKVDSMTEVLIAARLARQLNNYESENYARAVHRCVTCNFDTYALDFDEQEYREAFYRGVVVPLQEDYRHATGQPL